MLSEQWDKLPNLWKAMAYKEWLLFLRNKFPCTILWGDSYGFDFLLCKVLNKELNFPNDDLIKLELRGSNEINVIKNIMSIKSYGFPSDVNCIYSELNDNYKIYE